MAPQKSISEEQIILAAFELIRSQSASSITARQIAMKLGCSTMPIYSTLGSMNDVNNKLIEIGYLWLEDFRHSFGSGCPLIDLEMAMVMIAQNDPHLWHLMFLHEDPSSQAIQFPNWMRLTDTIAAEIDNDQDSLAERAADLKTIGYSIYGACAAVTLGSFFYHRSVPKEPLVFFLDFFTTLNRKNLGWYKCEPVLPSSPQKIYSSTIKKIIKNYPAGTGKLGE